MHPVTMRDVAAKAQVSVRTVSRVVNSQGEITEATRQRVVAAIDELGYRPSKVARALVTQHSETLGLIFPDVANPFFSEVARAVQHQAQAHGYDVFFYNSDGSWEIELRALRSLADHAVDGIILCPSSGLTLDRFRPFADRFRPIVTIVHALTHPHTSAVLTATRAGARMAVDHLLDRGHRVIGLLGGPGSGFNLHSRHLGYRDALLARGLDFRSELVYSGAPVFERGYTSTIDLLQQHPDVTAIFAYNDLLALGALRACRSIGRRVPEDCAVIGFDDIPLADWVSPALTTVRVDIHAMGSQAVTRLLEMLDAPDQLFPALLVPAELVVRETT